MDVAPRRSGSHDGTVIDPGYHRSIRIREISMLGRIVAVTLTIGALMTSIAALAQRDPVAGAVAGAIEGAAIASGLVVPYEQREPLRTYVYREPRPDYRYEDEVAVGGELRPGAYESYPVPEQYGVPEHHYAIVNGRAVIYHPQTSRIIPVYDERVIAATTGKRRQPDNGSVGLH